MLRSDRTQPFARGREVLLAQRVDLGVERGGLCLRELVAPAEELVQGEREVRGDARQQAHVREALSELPLAYGGFRNAEVGGERDAGTAPLPCDRATDVYALAHGSPSTLQPAFTSSMRSSRSGIKGALVDIPRTRSTEARRRSLKPYEHATRIAR